jgi:hypothetical protein
MSPVPRFAIAGDPNAGKSTLVATLAEDDAVEINSRAGTTTEATPYPFKLGERKIFEFIDLPGFENTAELREWFEQRKDTRGNLAKRFVEEHQSKDGFQAECAVFGSLAEDVAVIFVADATREVEEKDLDQAEVIRLCAGRRMAIINRRSTHLGGPDDSFLEGWKDLLERSFPIYKVFDPHRANFQDRLDLLEGLSHVVPGWEGAMKEGIRLIKKDWEDRIDAVADLIMELMEDALSFRAKVTIEGTAKTKAKEDAKVQVEDEVRTLEARFRKRVRDLFKHRKSDWQLPEEAILDADLFSEEVWMFFGLTKTQLILVGTAIGAAIGAGLDLLFGGLAFGIFTASLGFAGGISAWLAADSSVSVSLPGVKIPGTPFSLPGWTAGPSQQMVAQVLPNSNLLWILLDRALLPVAAGAKAAKAGVASGWGSEERKTLIDWIGLVKASAIGKDEALPPSSKGRDKATKIETAARDFLRGKIAGVTTLQT